MNDNNSRVTLASHWGASPVRSLFAGTSDPGGESSNHTGSHVRVTARGLTIQAFAHPFFHCACLTTVRCKPVGHRPAMRPAALGRTIWCSHGNHCYSECRALSGRGHGSL